MLNHFYEMPRKTVKLEIYNTIVIVSNQEIKMLINFIVHTNCVDERNMRRLEKLLLKVENLEQV